MRLKGMIIYSPSKTVLRLLGKNKSPENITSLSFDLYSSNALTNLAAPAFIAPELVSSIL
jgi:hypothetical protein